MNRIRNRKLELLNFHARMNIMKIPTRRVSHLFSLSAEEHVHVFSRSQLMARQPALGVGMILNGGGTVPPSPK